MTNAEYFAQDKREGQTRSRPNRPVFSPQPHALRCANCDIEITWPPTISGSLAYCCPGCAQGGPCSCDYSQHPHTPARA